MHEMPTLNFSELIIIATIMQRKNSTGALDGVRENVDGICVSFWFLCMVFSATLLGDETL